MGYYRTCPHCGSAVDPEEKCICGRKERDSAELAETGPSAKGLPKSEAFWEKGASPQRETAKNPRDFCGKGGAAERTDIQGVFCPEWSLAEQTTPRGATAGYALYRAALEKWRREVSVLEM
jgi:hypothetical protein